MRRTTILGLVLLAFCIACRLFAPVGEFYANSLYPHISAGLSFASSVLPFSLEEIVVIVFAAAFIFVLARSVRQKEGFLRWLQRTAVLAMWLFVWFYMGWGNNYYRTGLYQRCGIQMVSYEHEAFTSFLEDYTVGLNRAAAAVGEYDRGVLEEEIKAFYSERATSFGYTELHRWQHVKKPLLNFLFSAVTVRGFMGPFFCEAQVNRSVPEIEYPYTLAHEMGHLSGVTSEAEANYWAFVFCRESGNDAVRYSGYLSVLPYVLLNARNLLPEDEFNAWADTVCEKAKNDFNASRQYWKGKKIPWIESIQRKIYGVFLRSNGISEGLKDYSGVVEMIITMDTAS